MKKILFIILALGLGINYANAQQLKDSEVPPLFKTNFSKLHPGTKVDKWEKEQNGYKGTFHVGTLATAVTLGPNGQLIQTAEDIAVADLPKAVTDYMTANAAGKKATKTSRITDAKSAISYRTEAGELVYFLDPAGTLLKKEAKK